MKKISNRTSRKLSRDARRTTEVLEERRLLSGTVMQPLLTLTPSTTSYVSGYTPAQISQAYGFNQLTGNGSGQTIAIVDAYRDPNAAADLHVFDQQFGLTDPNLTIVNQTGGSASAVTADAGWSTEIALDLEWAHAMAPQAKILLVEANSASISDLMTAVDYARHAAGVSVVSMSWGGSEFYGQQAYDSYFTTPAGHTGVSFVAASGDSGSWYGPSWPATSPNVLSVGGSVLRLTSTGAYGSETGWSYSTGGVSQVVPEPTYQLNAQSTGARTSPDVAYNATGYAIYDSVPYQGYVGWSVVGGTSAGSPQWASLIAIANQLRVAAGKAVLDGATGTLPMLYALYSAPGTAGYAAYTSVFNDITTGASSYFMRAHAGYDGVTGLGTPKAVQVVAALVGTPKTATVAVTPATPITNGAAKPAVVHQTVAATPLALAAQATVAQAQTVFSNTALFDHTASVTITQSVANVLLGQADVLGATSATSWFAVDQLSGGALSSGSAITVAEAAAPQAVRAIVTAVSAETPAVAVASEVVTQAFAPFIHTNALAAMATDGIADLAHESAMLGAVLSPDVAQGHSVAKRITALTLTADGILIAIYVAHVFNKRRTAQMAGALPPDTMIHPMGPDED